MKVLHLNTTDIEGGAARAARRLHLGLREMDVQSHMLVRGKYGSGAGISSSKTLPSMVTAKLERVPVSRYRDRKAPMFSSQLFPGFVGKKIEGLDPDIINLHWICDGYVPISLLGQLKQPLVWTLHDMWPFTGGCHYSQECNRFMDACGACPHLGSSKERDLSRRIWQKKQRAWKNLNLTVVALCQWMADLSQKSSLFRDVPVEIIPNGIDIQAYRPLDKMAARRFLGLPEDKQLVLFGALKATGDARKGFHLLKPALQQLARLDSTQDTELVIFGSSTPDNPPDFGRPAHYLGSFSDDISLAMIYSAADVFVAPSVQENLANTVVEALACGTPCVAFDIGGMPDMIDSETNGYLARPYETEDLAKGIAWVLQHNRDRILDINARSTAEKKFSLETQARAYSRLYDKILSSS